ncbi:MAG: response regulator [bacterium]|nr:response regulator [bacterium]
MEPLLLKHILVIEDDNVLVGMLKQSLEIAGFKVSHASNGEEGKTMALEGVPPPDLLIVDIDMPKMDGVTMLKMLRAKGMNVPAFVLTNFNQTEHVADAAEAGILEYLVKADWDLDQIVAKVKARIATTKTA